ncbi:hypothetical protein ACK3TF_001925 [Chlorella vulgaris]
MEAVRTAAAAGQGGSGGKSRHSRYWPSKVALHDTLDPTSYSCNVQRGSLLACDPLYTVCARVDEGFCCYTTQQTQLRAALHALYCSSSGTDRVVADAWLRNFTAQVGAWQPIISLLSAPDAAVHERFFAAVSLRHSCHRQPSVAEPAAWTSLAPLLAQQLAAAVATGCQHTSNQLAATLATVAVRAPACPEHEVLPQLLALAHAALRDQGSSRCSGELQQLAMLHLLMALAEAVSSKEASMHPQRRLALRAALTAAPQPLEEVLQALAHGSSTVQAASLQLLQAWCALGAPPAGSEHATALWHQLHLLALHPQLGSDAAEALAALYAACSMDSSSSDGGSSDGGGAQCRLAQRRCQVLLTLLGQLPGLAAALQQALAQLAQQGDPQQQAQLLFAALSVLGAAAKVADGYAESAEVPRVAAAEAVQLAASVALAALQHQQRDVTLAALQHWDEQLERWKASSSSRSSAGGFSSAAAACSLEQQQELLGALCGVLLQRMTLPASLPPSAFTADARDVPDAVSRERRELADTFRAAAERLGSHQARRQLLQLSAEAAAAGAPMLQQECCLYALNAIWGQHRSQQPQQEAAEEAQQAAAVVAAALCPSAPKLAGTALTLLGGMGEQLLLQPQQMEALLQRLLQLLNLPGDAKLSRNAATCCHRLTSSRRLSAMLAAQHAAWCDALCGCFAALGGLQQWAQEGLDLSTPQFLLVSICHLAAAAADVESVASAAPAAAQGSQGVALLLHLLRQPAAAADAALSAAGAAQAGSDVQQARLDRAAIQVDSIALALEAVAGASHSSTAGPVPPQSPDIVSQLPSILAAFNAVLRRATAMAAASQPPPCGSKVPLQQQHRLLQAVCRLAAALAATPAAGQALELLQPLAEVPRHPCVLQTLAKLAAGTGTSASSEGAASHQQLHSMRSYHREPCEAVIHFTETLCCIGLVGPARMQLRHGDAAASTPPPSVPLPPAQASQVQQPAAIAARHHLQQCLDGGLGAQLTLGLLLAASGRMPPYMMVLIAESLHRTWLVVGNHRFGAWLRQAAQQAPEAEAPWRRWKPEAQRAAVEELLSSQCAQDPRRFKRLLKVMCGGKKKGRHVDQPARG